MKNDLFKWLNLTFNDMYYVCGGNGVTTYSNFIDHSEAVDNECFWIALQRICPEVFKENPEEYSFTSDRFDVKGEGFNKYVIIPFDNEIYRTHLIGEKE